MAFLADDNVTAVKCVFTDISAGTRNEIKTYTYKTNIKDLKVGDLVLVECAGPSNEFGFCCVKVVEIDAEIDLSTEIKYKWIVTKIDTTQLEQTKKAERELVRRVKSLEMKSKKQKLREALGLEGVELPSLADLSSAQEDFEDE
jgi:predicted RNA-binding protein with PUA-like domain